MEIVIKESINFALGGVKVRSFKAGEVVSDIQDKDAERLVELRYAEVKGAPVAAVEEPAKVETVKDEPEVTEPKIEDEPKVIEQPKKKKTTKK